MSEGQGQLDSRAIEAAIEANTLAQLAREEIGSHKAYCIERDRLADEERREAKRERHDFRAEVGLTLHRMGEASDEKFKDVIASIRRLYGRQNAGLIALLGLCGTIILLLLASTLYLLRHQLNL